VNVENCLLLLKKYEFEVKERGFERFMDPNVSYNKEFSCYSGSENVFINYLNHPHRMRLEGYLEQDLSEEEIKYFLDNLKEEGKIVLKRFYPLL
jgi:hypothetical protein